MGRGCILLSIWLLCDGIDGQAATRISIPSQEVRPGSSIIAPIEIESEDGLFGAQFDVLHDPENLIGSLATAPTSAPAHVIVKSSFVSPGRQRVVVYSQGIDPIASGRVAEVSFLVPPDIAIASTSIRLAELAFGTTNHEPLELEQKDGVLSLIFIPCLLYTSPSPRD